ncbi:MAG: DNA-3-methyladenine glycosylase [Bacteroidetes bacterium]|nr:DNA-3-methyladenine glycosylase [Bacteroidota bacterium]
MKLSRDFYLRDDVVIIARDLIGKKLITCIGGKQTTGMITETEAYEGETDRASHAFGGRKTQRTEIMYQIGGRAYIYLCYGIHSLFNIVTNQDGIPHAVLIRGIKPLTGLETMLERTGKKQIKKDFGNGPGKVSRALGIHYSQTGIDLLGDIIWLEENKFDHEKFMIETTIRVGIDYAGEDARLPYRFVLKEK